MFSFFDGDDISQNVCYQMPLAAGICSLFGFLIENDIAFELEVENILQISNFRQTIRINLWRTVFLQKISPWYMHNDLFL